MAMEIVDLAIKNCGFPYSCVSLPEGKLWYLNTSDDQILDDLPLISIAIVQWLCYQRITHCTSGTSWYYHVLPYLQMV